MSFISLLVKRAYVWLQVQQVQSVTEIYPVCTVLLDMSNWVSFNALLKCERWLYTTTTMSVCSFVCLFVRLFVCLFCLFVCLSDKTEQFKTIDHISDVPHQIFNEPVLGLLRWPSVTANLAAAPQHTLPVPQWWWLGLNVLIHRGEWAIPCLQGCYAWW